MGPSCASPGGRWLPAWTRIVIRGRFAVVACWVVLAVVGALSTGRLTGLLSTSLAVPGTSSQTADAILTRSFGDNIEGSFTVVLRQQKTSARRLQDLEVRFATAARSVRGSILTPLQSAVGIVYGQISTPLDLQQAASETPLVRAALVKAGLGGALVTGAPALQHDITPILRGDLHRGELIALVVALVLLTLVLGLSPALVVPLAVAACTTFTALLVVFGLAHRFLMVLYVPNVVELVGLGISVDYSLLIVHRFRHEAGATASCTENAITATMATAGRTVMLSGLAVAMGLTALFLIPVPFVRSLGFAGLVVPLVSILAALSLQPALLAILGTACTKRLRPWGAPPGPEAGPGFWTRLAGGVLRRRFACLGLAGALLAAAIVPVAWLQVTPGSLLAIPRGIQAATALSVLEGRVGQGVLTPVEIVLDTGRTGGALATPVAAATTRLARALLVDPEVFVVAIGSRPPYVDGSARYARILVVGRAGFGDEGTQQLVARIRSRYLGEARFPAYTHAYVGGAPAQGVDFLDRTYGAFPWIVLLILVLAYIVMLVAFRSLLLPLLAVILDVFSVAAAYGLLVLVFRFGVGADLLGLYRVTQIEGWVPVFLFAMLFGLSMDYEFFFVSRMRESWDRSADTACAISDGLARTGRVVSAAALIMVGALSGLVAGRVAGLQELGIGLSLGVLVDAFVVRVLLMPALMSLCGRWNWWLPLRGRTPPKAGPVPELIGEKN